MSRTVTYKLAVTSSDYFWNGELSTDNEWLARETVKSLRASDYLVGVFVQTSYTGTEIIKSEEEWLAK
jgi:hypothetical protein